MSVQFTKIIIFLENQILLYPVSFLTQHNTAARNTGCVFVHITHTSNHMMHTHTHTKSIISPPQRCSFSLHSDAESLILVFIPSQVTVDFATRLNYCTYVCTVCVYTKQLWIHMCAPSKYALEWRFAVCSGYNQNWWHKWLRWTLTEKQNIPKLNSWTLPSTKCCPLMTWHLYGPLSWFLHVLSLRDTSPFSSSWGLILTLSS